jgi:uncharacterized protein YndB with AHSA1/START domain
VTELVITRIFDAPRAMVYRAFVDPDQLARWFAPAGWSVPRDTVSMDVRPGGHQRFTMVNDDDPAMISPVNAVFVEVVENELLIGEEPASAEAGTAAMRIRIEFHDEEGGRTRLVLTQGPYDPEIEGMARAGWTSSFAKLDKVLAR